MATQREVVVPAVTSCSSIISFSDVKILTSMPRSSALRRADRTGGAVMLGVWMRTLLSAFAIRVKMKVFSGVGGAMTLLLEAKGLKCGLRRCGLGRKRVVVSDESDGSEAFMYCEIM